MDATTDTGGAAVSWDVFIAHAGADLEVARRLYAALSGFCTVFLDAESLAPADCWDVVIPEAQRQAKVTVVLVSPASTAAYYLREEIAAAIQLARAAPESHRVIPVYLDGLQAGDARTPYGLRIAHGLDLTTMSLEEVAKEITAHLVGEEPEHLRRPAVAGTAPAIDAGRRLAVYERLVALPLPSFARLASSLGFLTIRPDPLLPQATQAVDVVHQLRRAGDLAELEGALDRYRPTGAGRLLAAALHSLATVLPPLYQSLASLGVVRPPANARAVDDYLADLRDEMTVLNTPGLFATEVVPARAGALDGVSRGRSEYRAPARGPTVYRRVRQVLRVLTRPSHGGDHASARLAAAQRASRVVKNVERVLQRSREPLVILGDPGSGKSMILREVTRRLAGRQRWSAGARVPVYVRLGRWRVSAGMQADRVLELIEASIPMAHKAVRDALPVLIAEGQLVVVFDGMDEMDRSGYGHGISLLSDFAHRHKRRIKTILACRINDFSPAFEHRQLVLLPFDRAQVQSFVRNSLRHPLEVEEVSYTDRRFVRELFNRPTLRELAPNPLMLFLICHFISETRRWPASRTEVFELFLDTLVDRLERRAGVERLLQSQRAATIDHWARLAYAISAARWGTEIPRAEAEASSAEAAECLGRGIDAGLLLVDPDTGFVRFSHHRLQEYLTARHLAAAKPQFDWEPLLDAPRWQETLISLSAIDPASDGLRVLADSLVWPKRSAETTRKPDSDAAEVQPAGGPDAAGGKAAPEARAAPARPRKLDSEVERILADRAVLASEVMREAAPAAAGGVRDHLRGALAELLPRLSSSGRPTSQVKMLWAFNNVADLVPFGAVNDQLHSELRWVRNQAILLVGALARRGIIADRDLSTELAVDLAKGSVLASIPTYVKAGRESAGLSWLGLLSWAVVCQLLVLVVQIAAVGDFLLRIVERFPILGLEPPWDAVAASAALIVLTALLSRSIPGFHPALTGMLVAGFLAAVQIFASSFQFHSSFPRSIGEAVRLGGSSFLPLLFLIPFINWIGLLLFLAPLTITRSMAMIRMTLRACAPSLEVWLGTYLLLGRVLVFPVLFFVGAPWVGEILEGGTRSLGKVAFALIAVVATVAAIGWISHQLRRRDLKATLKDLLGFGLLLLGLVVVVVILVGFDAATSDPTFRSRTLFVLALLLALTIGVVVIRSYWQRLRLFTGRRRLSLAAWKAGIERGSPRIQYHYLRTADWNAMRATAGEFLAVLERVEPKVWAEPAASEYWRLRHELEQTIRQERADGA